MASANVNLAGKYSAVIEVDTNAAVITFDPNLKIRAFKNTTAEVVYIQWNSNTVTATTAAATDKLFLGLNASCDVPEGVTHAAVKTAAGSSILLFLAKG